MKSALSVSKIKKGTVIDHIPRGEALNILRFIDIQPEQHAVTVGMNLMSKKSGMKDMIKITNHHITDALISEIAVFAPGAIINLIEGGEVVKKIEASSPASISAHLKCPNANCITNAETVETVFKFHRGPNGASLVCHFCEKTFSPHQVKEFSEC